MVSRLPYLNINSMKRKIILLLISILTVSVCFAQSDDDRLRKKYINLGFINTTMSQDGLPDLKSNYGAAFTVGRTYFLHKKPIAGFLRFGIDATWFDLNYTNYDIKHIGYWGSEEFQYHQGEISMHIGPSITLTPVKKFNINGYFRYAPSFSAMYMNGTFYGNYATFFVGGAYISYGVFGIGIEKRFGDCEYKELWSDNEDAVAPSKMSHNGWKAYITFRF